MDEKKVDWRIFKKHPVALRHALTVGAVEDPVTRCPHASELFEAIEKKEFPKTADPLANPIHRRGRGDSAVNELLEESRGKPEAYTRSAADPFTTPYKQNRNQNVSFFFGI